LAARIIGIEHFPNLFRLTLQAVPIVLAQEGHRAILIASNRAHDDGMGRSEKPNSNDQPKVL
jgi:hypothetical protein